MLAGVEAEIEQAGQLYHRHVARRARDAVMRRAISSSLMRPSEARLTAMVAAGEVDSESAVVSMSAGGSAHDDNGPTFDAVAATVFVISTG